MACPEQEETSLPLASTGPHDSPPPRTSRTPLASLTTTIGIKHGESFLEVCHLVFAESVWPHGFRMNLLCTRFLYYDVQAFRWRGSTEELLFVSLHIIMYYRINSSPETVLVVEVVSTLRRNVPYLHTSTYFLGHKIHPCLSTNSASEATMVVSGFGPYHRLVHDDAPTGHAGVILTSWAMPTVLGLGAIHLGGEWHVPPPPPCICPILR
jgi:hypothetical protein